MSSGLLFISLAILLVCASGSYVTFYAYADASSTTCTGTMIQATVFTVGTCYSRIGNGDYLQITTDSSHTNFNMSFYSNSGCTGAASDTDEIINNHCYISAGGMYVYSGNFPAFNSAGYLQTQYSNPSCQGNVLTVWLSNSYCVAVGGESEKAVCSNGEATIYFYSTSTSCSGSPQTFSDQVFSSCTPVASGGIQEFAVASETSTCTGNTGGGTNSDGDVGSLTGQQVIWAMIGGLVGAALLGAALTTFLCPNCVKTGFGGESSSTQNPVAK